MEITWNSVALNAQQLKQRGITYESLYKLCKINKITEYNIGHFLISDSIFNGLPNVIRKVKKIIKL